MTDKEEKYLSDIKLQEPNLGSELLVSILRIKHGRVTILAAFILELQALNNLRETALFFMGLALGYQLGA
jgi:hypothetical protein